MTRSLLLVPRWGGSVTSDFYPWLREQLVPHDIHTEVVPLDSPPTIEQALATLVPRLEAAAPETIVLGHSVGVRALLHALAATTRGVPLAGMVAVAGWFTVDRPWPTIMPWVELPLAYGRVRAAVDLIHVLVSDNDPFTADDTRTRAEFEVQLGARVELVPGGKHFNAAEEPAVLGAVLDVLRQGVS